MLRLAGDVGLWAGCYAAAAFVCVLQLSGAWHGSTNIQHAAFAAVSILLITTGAYALDRVKLRDAWIDPSDVQSRPQRYEFLTRHTVAVRWFAAICFLVGALAGIPVSPWAPFAALGAFAGVVAYAPMPRAARSRLKDVLWLKNAYVACGMTGFVALAVIATSTPELGPAAWLTYAQSHAGPLLAACLLLFVRTWLDAAVCDIDDEAADRANRTGTLPTSIGGERTWTLTGLLRIALIGATLASIWSPLNERIVWAAANICGFLILRWLRPARLSDAVDLRFPAEAAFATLLIACLR